MPAAHDIYTDQLRDLRKGQPIYYPEPSDDGPVEVGDVGFMMEGAFCRLFNAGRAASDPTQVLGVPDGFIPLDIGRMRVFEAALEPGPLCSKTIFMVHAQLDTIGAVLPANASFQFTCTSSQGAILILETQMRREVALSKSRFKNYAEEYGRSWYEFARQKDFLIHFGDIMIITECCKTASWASAVYSQSSKEFGISFHVGGAFIPSGGSVAISTGLERIRSVEYRRSQTGALAVEQLRDALKDQTVFIKGYHVGLSSYYWQSIARRIMKLAIGGMRGGRIGEGLSRHIDAGATNSVVASTPSPDRLAGSGAAPVDSIKVPSMLPNYPDFEPAIALLAYIIETTNSEIVVVHDDDWCGSGGDKYARIIDAYSQHFFNEDNLNSDGETSFMIPKFIGIPTPGVIPEQLSRAYRGRSRNNIGFSSDRKRAGISSSDDATQSINDTNKFAVDLRKGEWPKDYMDLSLSRIRPRAITSKSSSFGESNTRRTSDISPVSASRRKLAILGVSDKNNVPSGFVQFPRRPTHRARQSLDSSTLISQEPSSRFRPYSSVRSFGGISPDLASSPTGQLVLRRHSTTKQDTSKRNAVYLPSTEPQKSGGFANDPLVPFPRLEDHGSSPPIEDISDGSRVHRGRFQSDVGSTSARRQLRPPSKDGISQSSRSRIGSRNLNPRDSASGSILRRIVTIKEEGKSPTHFQLGNCVGRGQFGSVYRALNLNTGQTVAVKQIRLEGLKEEEIKTLMKEVNLVKSLSHPSIVKYEGMARDEDTLCIVLEYAENGSLRQTIEAFGKLNERLVSSYVVKILEGLHYLHSSQVVHCDLRAANILTTKNGDIKLSDFGVSLNLRAMEREIKDVAGTPNWMAPEVIELKGPSTKSDIWSLGCTVIELLTGRPPYADISNSMSVMFRIVEDDMPPIPEGCSPPLEDFLTQCFHKDPKMRPSAEILCEHPWLRKNWGLQAELRPQDSIPFLRRIGHDLSKSEVSNIFPLTDSISGALPAPADVVRLPRRRISDTSAQFLADNDTAPREHSFVKTTFAKPMVCRVCLLNVKKSAMLCEQCSLIAHAKCAGNALPTCDLRSQLLPYAKFTEMDNSARDYHSPVEDVHNVQSPGPSSDITHGALSASMNVIPSSVPAATAAPPPLPPPPPPPGRSSRPSTGNKILLALKRSKANFSQPSVTPSSQGVRGKDADTSQKTDSMPVSVTTTAKASGSGLASTPEALPGDKDAVRRRRKKESNSGCIMQ